MTALFKLPFKDKIVVNLLFATLVSLLTFSTPQAQSLTTSTATYYGLSGTVQSLKQSSHVPRVVADRVVAARTKPLSANQYKLTFSPQGWIIESNGLNALGGSYSLTTNQFGSNLRRTSSRTDTYNMQGESLSHQTVNYNAEGNPLEEVFYTCNFFQNKTNYSYDHEGRLVRFGHYNELGIPTQYTTISYGDNGLPTRIDVYRKQGKLVHRYEYAYDANGALTAATERNGKGKMVNQTELQYNANRELSASKNSATGSRAIEALATVCPVIGAPMIYESGKKENRYTYRYDQEGNWVECVVWSKGKPTTVLQRDIVYY